ncbi:MAG: type II toxin-antitoxin system RelE/ParE family toxin [Terracidiphilus sp.]|jgi:toxin ParE1/3/4
MQFHITKKAERELDEIFDYWVRRAGVDVADRFIDSIEERFALLGDYPFAGRKCDEFAPGVFRFPAGDYLIYYRKKRGVIQTLHVFQGARDQARALRNG